jgi:arylsulfatase A-like enzyme
VGIAAVWLPAVREARQVASLPPASAGSPNIVLVVLDTVRLDTLASLPNYARLAASGVRFDRAIATSSWTLESHASMFTGRYPQHVFPPGVTPINFETPMPAHLPTMAEALRDHGYLTAGFVANTNYTSREHGLARGFVHYDDYPVSGEDALASTSLGRAALDGFWRWRQRPRNVGRRSGDQITRAFLDWFDRHRGRPVFAFLNYFDAHDAYLPPDGYRSQLPAEPSINPYKRYPTSEVASHRRAYEDCVRYIDDVLGRLIRALEDRHALDSTVLVVTSDHGEHFGERDLMTHGNSLYRELVEVPLTIRFPNAIRMGTTVGQFVSLRDLPATLLEFAGVSGHPLPGTSLSVLWREGMSAADLSPAVSTLIVGDAPHHFAPDFWPVRRGSMRSAIADGFHYIRNGDGVEELYDLAADPRGTSDISRRPENAVVLGRLRSIVDRVERSTGSQ